MIILEELRWSNCFSYGEDNCLILNTDTVTQILGTNGAGKSSIPLIIEEVLFNKNSKGIKKGEIQNRFINKGYSISLSFTKDSIPYEIAVKRTGATLKAVLKQDGKDISSHTATNTYKTLQDILGLDFKTFSQVVYQSTNSSLQFLTATDTNRKRFLIDLLHLERYVDLFDVFRKETVSVNQKVSNLQGQITNVEEWLESNKVDDTTVLPVQNLEISTEREEREISSLTEEIEKISEKNKKIQRNNQNRELLDKIDLRKWDEHQYRKKESYDEFQTEAGTIKSDGAAAKKMLEKLESLGDTCPTCEQSIDREFKQRLIEDDRRKLERARVSIETLKEKINEIKENNRLVERRDKDQRDWEDLFRSIEPNLSSTLLDKRELSDRLDSVRGDLQRKKRELAEQERENERRTRHNARLELIREQRDGFEGRLFELSGKLAEVEHLSANLEILKKAFSTNGLIAYKIENLVKELEDLVNEYLAELSDGKFTLAFIINKDKLNVSLTDNGVEVDISALSSGELARVNTSTLLAIRKLMSSISKARINILFLDEVISTLDDTGRENLVEVLMKEESLNTYLVSHQWYHPLLAKLNISKDNNISKVENS